MHAEVRKGGSQSNQCGVTWKLCPGCPLRIERSLEKRAGTVKSGVGVLREAIKGDAFLRALSELLTWRRKSSYFKILVGLPCTFVHVHVFLFRW